jgi:hypothetical protein
MSSNLRFIQTSNPTTQKVGVGLSSIVGPTGPQGTSFVVTNTLNNRILTSVDSTTANAESNLTFDGSLLNLIGNMKVSDSITFGTSNTGTIYFSSSSNTGIAFNSDIVPTSNNLTLGNIDNPWRSIYVNTGTVFIGPTGTLQINNNGFISSVGGFSSPVVQIGDLLPGNGIELYNLNNTLYYKNSSGATGPVSIFKVASNSVNNTYFTGGNLGIGESSPTFPLTVKGGISCDSLTGTSVNTQIVTTDLIKFDGLSSMYFKTGSSTGCFIGAMNYNPTGTDHYVYYNSRTKELAQASPNYFYSYSTGTQTFTANNVFQPVTFNVNNILYHTFEHTMNSSAFTGTFTNPVTMQISYSVQIHTNNNTLNTAAIVMYLDESPINGSYRSCSTSDSSGEYPVSNTFLVNVPNGRHSFQLQAAVSDINHLFIGGSPNIPPPGNSYTSANICCTRIL